MSSISSNYKTTRAAVALATAAFLFVQLAFASAADRYIDKAKNLSLQRERVQAARVLKEGLDDPSLSSTEKTKIENILTKLSEMFYSAQGLQEYELGASISETRPKEARQKWVEILKAESQNMKVLLSLAALDLSQGDCGASIGWVLQAQDLNPNLEALKILEAQSLACDGKRTAFLKLWSDSPKLQKNIYFQMSALQIYYQASDWENFDKLISLVTNRDFPEVFYYLGLSQKQREQDTYLESLARYVGLCEEIGKLKKKYPNEPRICAEAENVKTSYELPSGTILQKIVK